MKETIYSSLQYIYKEKFGKKKKKKRNDPKFDEL